MVDLVAVLRRAALVSNTDRSLLTALADWMEKPLIDPAMGTRADHIARKIEALAEMGESDG